MKIKELKDKHPRIYELAMLRQKEAGNEANDEVLLNIENDGKILSFSWMDSKEGGDFWDDIDEGNFDVFYQKYPQINDLPLGNTEMLEVKDPINKARHDKFDTKGSVPLMRNPPEPPKKPQQDAIKPDYYRFAIKEQPCDLFQIAEAMGLSLRLFSALKYFRFKGDKVKQINDLEKAIECIKLEIERLKG